ncbi:MAG: hypothetical protein AB8B91_01750 [Rubripirellula sp.]
MSLSPTNDELPITDPVSSEMQSRPACCSLSRMVTPAIALIAVAAICVAAYLAGRQSRPTASVELPMIHAAAAVSSEKYSIATGMVGEDAEGLFALDHNSGVLQCTVIYPRIGRFLAQFSANVAEALGAGGKGGSYIMLAGRADFPRASNRPAGACVVYVMDTATGNWAAYGIPFDRSAVNAGRQQKGMLVLLTTGSANPVVDRDSLR